LGRGAGFGILRHVSAILIGSENRCQRHNRREALAAALDAERRGLMARNEERLECYESAAREWAAAWPDLAREIEGLPLPQAHARVLAAADGCLPTSVPGVE
jgi:hypothetical protein